MGLIPGSDKGLTMLSITGYKAIDFSDELGTLEAQMNPQKFGMKYSITWGGTGSASTNQGQGSNGGGGAQGESSMPPTFSGYQEASMDELELIADATGIVPISDGLASFITTDPPSIVGYIEELKRITYDWVGDTHGPPYIKIMWGEIIPSEHNDSSAATSGVFKGVLESLEVDYELFSLKGIPVRAKIKLKLKAVIDPAARATTTNSSPDLTHFIDIKYGDNLSKICKDIYGSPEFVTQIAKINNLPSIYALKPGMKLRFPPLDKASR
ncbi:MAG: LysM peptidoglycan-binding domain-containing protein [Aureispira sp.]|nr:LysM peptidoglycan-binding domain-containing protein [Aureispira sp.]